MARKKVVFVIVEGPSDDTALGAIFSRIFNKEMVHVEIYHGDITADQAIDPVRIASAIADTVKKYANSMHFKQLHFLRVIHIIDMDGAYVPDSCILKDVSVDGVLYDLKSIRTAEPERIIARNAHKRQAIDRLSKLSKVWGTIPYQAYYMSRNLDHAPYGKLNSSDVEKEDDAYAFAKKYKDDTDGFLRFISEMPLAVRGNYLETWKYIKEGLHSLERHTNLVLCFTYSDVKRKQQ